MSQIQADVTMDTKLNSTDNNQMLIASQSPLPDTSHEGQTGMIADNERINYSSNVQLKINTYTKRLLCYLCQETEPSLHKTQNGRVTRAASVCSSISAEKHGSDSLPNALLPPSVARTEREASIRRPERLKTSTVNTEPDSDGKDICKIHLVPFNAVSQLNLLLSEIFVLQFSWPVSSVNHWTVYWHRSEDVTNAFGRYAHPHVAATP